LDGFFSNDSLVQRFRVDLVMLKSLTNQAAKKKIAQTRRPIITDTIKLLSWLRGADDAAIMPKLHHAETNTLIGAPIASSNKSILRFGHFMVSLINT
jgi:hypothetical protein